MDNVVSILGLNAGVLATAMIGLWLISLAIRDVSFIDSVWALGMVALAYGVLLQDGPPTTRDLLLVGLCTVWGLRLGGHLLARWRSHGPDPRYTAMLSAAESERGWGFGKATLLLVFLVQAPFLFIVCLPVQLGQIGGQSTPLGLLAMAGAVLSVTGIVFETVGDWQLARFRGDPANRGKVLHTGLWRYTRHPNYFGDACVWWGLYLIAAETPMGIWALPGPILLTTTLVKWSGAALLEGRLRETRPDYADYIETTSGFIPWPPKRR